MVLFRVDAGPSIGLGHLARCLTLADALGEQCVFATTTPDAVSSRLGGHRLQVISAIPGSDEDAASIPPSAVDVVVDGYVFGDSHARALAGRNVLWIDDAGFPEERPGMVLNHNLYATPALYPSMQAVLAGPDYALVRDEFLGARSAFRQSSRHKVLVTLGGSDPVGMTFSVMAALDQVRLRRPIDARILVGPSNPRADELRSHADVIVDSRDVGAEMAWADVAITAGGGTCMEVCCVGVAALVIPIADNQVPVAEILDRRGLMRRVPGTVDAIAAGLEALLDDANARDRMTAKQRATVDGLGKRRVIERFLK